MSIIVAAGVGLAAGSAASGFIFNYTKNEYEQKISELERVYGQDIGAQYELVRDLETLLREGAPMNAVPSVTTDENGDNKYSGYDCYDNFKLY